MKITPHSHVLLESSGNSVVGDCTFLDATNCTAGIELQGPSRIYQHRVPWTAICYCSQGPSDVSASQRSSWIGLELHDPADAEVAAATAQLCCDVQEATPAADQINALEDSVEAKLDAQQHDRQSGDGTRGAFPYNKWHKIRYGI